MSQGEKMPLAMVEPIARELVEWLAPFCERIAIAGSIRRCKRLVGDIEIVAIAKVENRPSLSLFGDPERVDLLAENLAWHRMMGKIRARDVEVHRKDGTLEHSTRVGSAYQALVFRDVPVDLFITTADQWGVIYALRTGPGDWNVRLVTDCKRYFRSVVGGQVIHAGKPVPCLEEADFFRAIGQPWVEPADRRAERVAIGRPT